jgi:hypothetical protein
VVAAARPEWGRVSDVSAVGPSPSAKSLELPVTESGKGPSTNMVELGLVYHTTSFR